MNPNSCAIEVDPDPSLADVVDIYGVTPSGLFYTPDHEPWTEFTHAQVEVCPCAMWQLEYHDADMYPDRDDDLDAALAEHRAECGVFDMLAGLQGVPI